MAAMAYEANSNISFDDVRQELRADFPFPLQLGSTAIGCAHSFVFGLTGPARAISWLSRRQNGGWILRMVLLVCGV